MLFMGFESDFDAHILNFPYQSEAVEYQIADRTASGLSWLEGLEDHSLPFAIFCKLSWLKADDFAFARQVMSHPVWFQTPLVALASEGEIIDPALMCQNGIDDCYKIPVEWRTLEARIDFLKSHKHALLEQGERLIPEKFEFKIPLSKRVFDVIGATLGILLSAPLWLLVALAIKLESRGPIFYRSKRVGAAYHIFDFLKFRSMRSDADTLLAELQHLNQYQDGSGAPAIFRKINRDPRVTMVGRFIRKYSIDELPQLLNVLKGDMSLVGNRPLPAYEAEMLTGDEWSARFLAPAGLTGLWQVTKRGQTNMQAEERIALDIAYSKDYSLLTDMGIIF
ncbi:MAG: sugar transferase, partial [Saprospiraceae bacterium]